MHLILEYQSICIQYICKTSRSLYEYKASCLGTTHDWIVPYMAWHGCHAPSKCPFLVYETCACRCDVRKNKFLQTKSQPAAIPDLCLWMWFMKINFQKSRLGGLDTIEKDWKAVFPQPSDPARTVADHLGVPTRKILCARYESTPISLDLQNLPGCMEPGSEFKNLIFLLISPVYIRKTVT